MKKATPFGQSSESCDSGSTVQSKMRSRKSTSAKSDAEKVRRDVVREYGDAYYAFGLNKMMGHIIGLLLTAPEPVSLADICKQLGRSKGPISQIMRRLVERNLVRKVWTPRSRQDYYELQPNVFENAFRNHYEMIQNNIRIAKFLRAEAHHVKDPELDRLRQRLAEMEEFFTLMSKHHQAFLNEWAKVQAQHILGDSLLLPNPRVGNGTAELTDTSLASDKAPARKRKKSS
ncbi:MAG: MarR family transcriptional regulator [Chloroherpetonaceae bacterium]|nr:MarR family transcriptional regulator [Chloroherpetonaceae bacterium]MCS7210259.1 MarR family transcriptional regulator [Chloroherpetonaceae bacterium]MDW8020510.1 MarR family transcriptional regulator [Chloroherpetonaceae bacterium]